jgi:hypothetical protein
MGTSELNDTMPNETIQDMVDYLNEVMPTEGETWVSARPTGGG